jgi:hypothetical protein
MMLFEAETKQHICIQCKAVHVVKPAKIFVKRDYEQYARQRYLWVCASCAKIMREAYRQEKRDRVREYLGFKPLKGISWYEVSEPTDEWTPESIEESFPGAFDYVQWAL